MFLIEILWLLPNSISYEPTFIWLSLGLQGAKELDLLYDEVFMIDILTQENPYAEFWCMAYSELSFLKQGRPRTYLLRLSVCPVWNQKNLVQPKKFGQKFDDDAMWGVREAAPKN